MQLRPVTSPPKAPVISRAWLDSIIAPKPQAVRKAQSNVVPFVPRQKPLHVFADECGQFIMPFVAPVAPRVDEVTEAAEPRISLGQILRTVAMRHGVTVDAIIGKPRSVAHIRQEVMWLARCMTHDSLPEIGRAMMRDHTTVVHGIRAHAAKHGLPDPDTTEARARADQWFLTGEWDVSKAGDAATGRLGSERRNNAMGEVNGPDA